MGETSYGRSRNLSVNWEFSKLHDFYKPTSVGLY
jgi:hypothetical protein